jgi:acetyl-CoA synthetase
VERSWKPSSCSPRAFTGNDSLVAELQKLIKMQYAAHAFPRRIHFMDALPKTPSGKVQRYILRQQRAKTQ